MTEEKKKKGLLKALLIIAILAVIGVGVHFIFFRVPFRYAGTLEATKVDLSAQVSSTVTTVDVHEGDVVTLGMKVMSLECAEVRLAAGLATENYERTLRLFHSGTASQESLDKMQNQKEDADVRLGWCDIKSPIQGTVLSRYHEPGEWVSPGVKLLTLANIRDIWAYIYVPQPEVSRLKPGMKLQGHLPELGDQAYEGTILKINEEAEFTPKNVQTRSERERLVFGVKVSFLGANEREVLKPGMTIEVDPPKE